MGAEESIPIPSPPPDFDYLVIGLSKWRFDKMIAMFAKETDLSLIREAICQHWGQGIESEKSKLEQAWAFKFNGNPFQRGSTPVQSACARKMLCQMFQNLNNAGWELKIASELSRVGEFTTFYFCRNQIPKPIDYPLLCVGLQDFDKLQLINTPDNILATIKKVIDDTWSNGIKSEGLEENFYKIKFSGNPWKGYGYENVQARFLLTSIFSSLAQQNWKFHSSVNMTNTSDSLFFKYDPEGSQQASQRFVISFNEGDKLRLMNAPQDVIPVVRQVITSFWNASNKSIQKEQSHHESWEFKMHGYPWWGRGSEYVVPRFLICKMLEALQAKGWSVEATIDVTRRNRDKTILVLAPSDQRDSTHVMCLSFADREKLRLINAPEDLIGVCRDILTTRWCKGIAMEEYMKTSCPAHEFKLNGSPWHGAGELSLHIRSILCYIIKEFAARGWKFLMSADVTSSYDDDDDYPYDVHSWWFAFEPDGASFMLPPSYTEACK